MKKYIIIRAGIAIIACLLLQGKASAQTLVPPALPDNLWVLAPSIGCGINTAMIDFPVVDSSPNHPEGRLAACAYGGSFGGVTVTDINSGFTINIPYPVSGGITMNNCPDVILGNNKLSATPIQDFIMAVTFVNNSLIPQVEVDYFDIHYITAGGGPFTVTFNSAQIIPTPPAWTLLGTTHIDVVAQSSNTTLYGLPLCDHFFVTFDASTPGVYNVFVTYGSLVAYNALVAGPQRATLLCSNQAPESWQPDVAGVEMGPTGGTKDIARLTFVCMNSKLLYYEEWDPSLPGCAGFTNPFITLEGSPGPYPLFSNPRIDANDNHLTNAGPCQYQVACEYETTSPIFPHDVKIYGTPPSQVSWWENLFALPPIGTYLPASVTNPYNNYRPAVAYAPNTVNGNQYMVTNCTNLPLHAGSPEFFLMNPMNMCGSGVAPSPGSGPEYFEVNSLYPATSAFYANSVSTPCNNVYDISLVAWTNMGNIYYKTTVYFPFGTGYVYRHSNPEGISAGRSKDDDLTVFPNPANEHVTVSNPASINADRYCIKNVIGQIVRDGALTTGNNSIDVSNLVDGSYIICAYKEGTPVSNKMFIKNN